MALAEEFRRKKKAVPSVHYLEINLKGASK